MQLYVYRWTQYLCRSLPRIRSLCPRRREVSARVCLAEVEVPHDREALASQVDLWMGPVEAGLDLLAAHWELVSKPRTQRHWESRMSRQEYLALVVIEYCQWMCVCSVLVEVPLL